MRNVQVSDLYRRTGNIQVVYPLSIVDRLSRLLHHTRFCWPKVDEVRPIRRLMSGEEEPVESISHPRNVNFSVAAMVWPTTMTGVKGGLGLMF